MIELDVREGIWALVGVLSLYLVVILFRLARPSAPAQAPLPQQAPAPEPAPATVTEVSAALPPVAAPLEELNQLEIHQLRRDLAQLRTEQDYLRRETALMRRDVDELREALATARERYSAPVSPQHSEAMLLAGRGISALDIAEQCGISVAEAELVCALARVEDRV